jgi:chromosome segregation ATPase
MKFSLSLMKLAALLLIFTASTLAQNAKSAAETLENLRSQLRDVQAKEASLQARLKQLDEDLKPENIEHSLAGIGSTRPEDLREQRRRQLAAEKASVVNQLEQLAASRARLEPAILTAEAAAYQQSAQGPTPPVDQILIAQNTSSSRWLVGALAGFAAILVLGAFVLLMRKLS